MNHLGEQVLSQKTSDKRPAIVILQLALHGTAHGSGCVSRHIIPLRCFGCVAVLIMHVLELASLAGAKIIIQNAKLTHLRGTPNVLHLQIGNYHMKNLSRNKRFKKQKRKLNLILSFFFILNLCKCLAKKANGKALIVQLPPGFN